MKLSTTLAVAMAGFTTVGTAQTMRDLDSHEHGSAVLNIAIDADALFLELDTPWNNLVGFEHEPGTDEQYALVNEAWSLLNAPERLFTLNSGDCSVSEVRVESAMPIEQHDDEHKDADHDDHKDDDHKHADHDDHKDDDHKDADHDDHKDDDHKDADHDDHKDDDHKDADHGHSHDEHQDEDTHTTALASYGYTCGDINQLSSIAVNVFRVWPGFEELNVQLIGPGGQTLLKLTADQSAINIEDIQ